jgi:hypothetical protein
MAYTHTQYQVNLTATGITAATSGVVGQKWVPGYVPHVVRAFCITNTATLGNVSSLVCSLERISHAAATTATAIATINGTATGGAGVVFYSAGLNATVNPGEELQYHISTAATVAALHQVTVWVEPKWEEPGNNTNMKATTT